MPADEHIQYVPESPGVDTAIVLWCGLAVLLLLAGAIGGLYAVYDYNVPIKSVPALAQFPQPRVVTSEDDQAELHRLRDEQSKRLQTWRWADDRHTLVQIPIDRAMKLLVQKGKNAYAPLVAPQPALSSPTAAAQNAMTAPPPASPNGPPSPAPNNSRSGQQP
ncbi:MAG TPA: hypothetical protein VHY10_04115 [Xanthobacteraceae bacterium]|jgi:hypothetical protein|nr:hypothetical protein [Xanthobacteraceae bacterium]